MFFAIFLRAFWLQSKGASRINRVSSNAPAFPSWSHSSLTKEPPGVGSDHLAPAGLLKLPSAHGLHKGCFYRRPPSVQQMRGRPYREGGEPWELSRNCGNSPVLVVLVSAIIYVPFTSVRRVGARPRCSGQPTRLPHCVPRHLTYTHFDQKDQADSTGHCYMHMVSLPRADPAQCVSAWMPQAPARLQPACPHHSVQAVYRVCFYKTLLFQNWERHLFCLIHIKNSKSNNMKRQKNIS